MYDLSGIRFSEQMSSVTLAWKIRHICQYIVSWQFCKFHNIVFYSQFIRCSWIMSRSRRIPSIRLSYGIDLHTRFPTQQQSPRKKRDTSEIYRSGQKFTDWHGFVIHIRYRFISGEWTKLGFSNYMFSCDTYIVIPLPFNMYSHQRICVVVAK